MDKSWKIIVGASLILVSLLISCSIGFCFPARVKFVIDGDTVELEDGTKLRYIGVDTPDLKPGEEIEPFARAAYEANKELVEDKNVWLELDVQKFDKYNRLLAYVFVGSIFVNGWLVENGYARTACYPPNVKYYHYFRHLEKESQEKGLGIWAKIATESAPGKILESETLPETEVNLESEIPPEVENNLELETKPKAENLNEKSKLECNLESKITEIFLGSKKSKKFHLPSCSYGSMIYPENLVIFKSREEALAAGFQPGKCCHP